MLPILEEIKNKKAEDLIVEKSANKK